MTADEARALLEKIAAGSEQALNRFYQDHSNRVYNFAYKRLNNTVDAAEVLNQVMMDVWCNAGRFEGRSKVTTWLLGITHHKVIDILRKRGRNPGEELPGDPEDENTPTAMDIMLREQDAVHIRTCLERLSDNHRQVVHMVFFEEIPYSEIAQIMDCPEGTVKTRMFHAKQCLKRCLSKLLRN
ncbi:MAG: sigma-70 family RNA polymerase sigma factor [Gammaproteobacteria bacterium]|nr:MAG: sigma-70 family RNA polymerase sigma factor [Gammaproteobacteria bacterium]